MSNARPEWYQLRDAPENANFPDASSLLETAPSSIHETNGIGETVLHFLAVENDQSAVEWLHTRGADLNACNKFGTPLLFEVAQLGYQDLFLWLVEHGADPIRKDGQGQRIDEYLADFDQLEIIEFIKKHIGIDS